MKREIFVEYQNYIDHMPKSPKVLHEEACANDEVTINSWRKTWEANVKTNSEKHGPFANKSVGQLFGQAKHKPVIIAGAGPSLKINAADLKNKGDVTLVSCLHNFHFLEDNQTPADYYITLDAGEVTIEEVYEGGSKKEHEYWDISKNRTLIAYIGTSPRLLEKWQGNILFYNAPVPDKDFIKFVDDIEVFNTYLSTGGNVLGACLYFAKAFLGASVIAFIGADFCFSYDRKFHAWDSKYDAKLGNVLRVKDVFGNSVYTWQSYYNFKGWFEFIASSVPGIYYNCSEGGTLGAYTDGNLRVIHQIALADFLKQMNVYLEIEDQANNPNTDIKKLLF